MAQTARTPTSREPVTRRVHDRPWTADLEADKHADDRELLVEEAVDAVTQTAADQHVDLVTHESHGHPNGYLLPVLETHERSGRMVDRGRCACGGYVTRVFVK